MKIIMKTLYASPERSIAPGQTADLPTAEAKALVDGGYAVPADTDPAGENTPAKRRRGGRGPQPPKGDGDGDSPDGDE